MANSTALTELKNSLQADTFKAKFEDVNGLEMDFKREVGFAMQALNKNNYLAGADRNSILESVYNVALTGLTLNPMLDQACLVPRKVKGVLKCTLEPTYKGMITKMIDLGQATDVYAHVVYDTCEFDLLYGTEQGIHHKPHFALGKPKGNEIGAYAVAVLPGGEKKYEFLTKERLDDIMKTSESWKSDQKKGTNYSLWTGPHREEMMKKSAVKALWKYMPKNQVAEQFGKVIQLDNEGESYSMNSAMQQEAAQQKQNKAQNMITKATEKVAAKQKPETVQFEDVAEAPQEGTVSPQTHELAEKAPDPQPEPETPSGHVYSDKFLDDYCELDDLKEICDRMQIDWQTRMDGQRTTKKSLRELIILAQEHNRFDPQPVELIDKKEQQEANAPASPEIDFSGIEPLSEDGTRMLGKAHALLMVLEENGHSQDAINSMITAQGLPFADAEDLAQRCGVDVLGEIFNA